MVCFESIKNLLLEKFTNTLKQKHAAPEQQLEKLGKGKKECMGSADKKPPKQNETNQEPQMRV